MGGLLGGLGKVLGTSSDFEAKTPELDKNAYQWGGKEGGAQADIDRYRGLAQAADMRQGPQIDNSNFYGDRGMEMGARGAQQYAMDQYRAQMSGLAPSVAQAQQQQGLRQAQMQQAQLAANARGGGANQAAAQRMAAMQGANLTGQAVDQAATLRAQEYASAANAFGGLASATRQGDLARGQLGAEQAYRQAGLEAQQRALNDQRFMGTEQLGYNVGNAQMSGQMGHQQQMSNNSLAAQKIQAGVESENAANAMKLVGAAAAAAGGGAAAGSLSGGGPGSDIRIKENIRSGHESTEQMLDQLHPYVYGYKEPEKFGYGQRQGVMAQDLEKSSLGAAAVQDTPEGKTIDMGKGLSLSLAGLANLHERQNETERELARYRSGRR